MQTATDGVPTLVPLANAAALALLVPVALHQLGVLEHLPDPPSPIFASDRITESKAAHPFGVPDGLLGLGSFAATLSLALLARSRPAARKLLVAKVLGDTAYAGFNVVRQVVSFRRLCSWCTGTAICVFVSTAAAAPLMSDELRAMNLTRKAHQGAKNDSNSGY